MIATTYGYVYVAQIAMGADHAPCINHGLKAKGGMGKSQAEEKGGATRLSSVSWRIPGCRVRLLAPVALQSPLAEEGKNPFSLDSKEPNWANFHDLTSSSSVATRHSSSKLGSALAAPPVPAGRGPLLLCQEGLSQRGRGALRRGPEDGPAALQDLRPQDAGGLEPGVSSIFERFYRIPFIAGGASNKVRHLFV